MNMSTLKGIAALVCFCAIGAGMFLFLMLGMLCLALRDGILAAGKGISRRLRGEGKPGDQPKIFYGGRDGVPNLVMDAEGFVEPPAALSLSSRTSRRGMQVGHLIPEGSPWLSYSSGQPWRNAVAAVGVVQADGGVKVLEFPSDPAERQRLIDSRPRRVDHATLDGDTVVFIHGRAGK
jgi:hypothetical protein